MRLRIKDIDFERGQIVLRETKGVRERVVPLPRMLEEKLRAAVEASRQIHDLPACGEEGRSGRPESAGSVIGEGGG